MAPPVQEKDAAQRRRAEKLPRQRAGGDAGYGLLQVSGGTRQQQRRRHGDGGQLLAHGYDHALPHPPNGGEVAVHHCAQPLQGHGQGQEHQRPYCAGVLQPEKAQRPGAGSCFSLCLFSQWMRMMMAVRRAMMPATMAMS